MAIHKGGCHCGTVTFEFEAPELMDVTDCNCSKCSMTGYLHVFIPQGDLKILSGGDKITTYTFGSHTAKHMFCSVCGIKSFYIPKSHPNDYSVNFHCISSASLEIGTIIPFDGRNWKKNIEALRAQT